MAAGAKAQPSPNAEDDGSDVDFDVKVYKVFVPEFLMKVRSLRLGQ